MSLLQLRFDSALNMKIKANGLILPHLWLAQQAAINRYYHCTISSEKLYIKVIIVVTNIATMITRV